MSSSDTSHLKQESINSVKTTYNKVISILKTYYSMKGSSRISVCSVVKLNFILASTEIVTLIPKNPFLKSLRQFFTVAMHPTRSECFLIILIAIIIRFFYPFQSFNLFKIFCGVEILSQKIHILEGLFKYRTKI